MARSGLETHMLIGINNNVLINKETIVKTVANGTIFQEKCTNATRKVRASVYEQATTPRDFKVPTDTTQLREGMRPAR